MGVIAKKRSQSRKKENQANKNYALEFEKEDVSKLSVDHLEISYEDARTGAVTQAVKDVSLDIKEGEFVSIVGLSGCGKSTFLNAVAGLTRPSSGTMKLDGKAIRGPGTDRAVVFQKASLLPWRTTVKNIIYGLEIAGIKKSEAMKQAKKYVELTKLNGFEDSFPSALSGGMQQRVNLARALACEPEMLLLDEPFSALDAITRETLQNELLDLWERTKKTVLLVTHQIDEAVLLSDRIIVFSAPAEIVADISVDLPRPRTPEVKNDAMFEATGKKVWEMIHHTTLKKSEIEYEI